MKRPPLAFFDSVISVEDQGKSAMKRLGAL
jgi:hypothetical protein